MTGWQASYAYLFPERKIARTGEASPGLSWRDLTPILDDWYDLRCGQGGSEGVGAMSAQERADAAAEELAKAVAEMGGPEDGEAVIIVRFTQDGSAVTGTTEGGDLFWHWDWFKRLKTDKPG